MSSNTLQIIAGYAQIDQDDSPRLNHKITQYQTRLKLIEQAGIEPIELVIEPLATPWQSQLPDNNFKSGCAPIMALARAKELIEQGHHAVVISGDDPLKTGYQRQERHELMAIYANDASIAELYDQLAKKFISLHTSTPEQFVTLAHALFDNHVASHQLARQQHRAHFPLPPAKWFNQVTQLFRGVDCANPLVDFSGRLLLCSNQLTKRLGLNTGVIDVKGVGLGLLDIDEPSQLDSIVQYQHLALAYQDACEQANIDVNQLLQQKKMLLELYTCYPIVPMAFLISCKLVPSLAQIPEFLTEHLVTITGGMNLARAPWNNPALNGLIEMYHQLNDNPTQHGLVHGNGGIGYRQGVAILANT